MRKPTSLGAAFKEGFRSSTRARGELGRGGVNGLACGGHALVRALILLPFRALSEEPAPAEMEPVLLRVGV
jgi:hypothetical protein